MNIYPKNKKGIAWTDATWNPVTGCTKVSDECKHCYAERIFPRPYPGRKFTNVQCHPDRLNQPFKVKKPLKIFVNSMSDLFHEDVPFEFIDKIFAVMALADWHTYQILTKRADRMLEYMNYTNRERLADSIPCGEWNITFQEGRIRILGDSAFGREKVVWPLPNVWLGVSAGTQAAANERIPYLFGTGAKIIFVSFEPLLERINWKQISDDFGGVLIDWAIVGGESESKRKARECSAGWIESIVKQCKKTSTPVFVKQLGSNSKWSGTRYYRWPNSVSLFPGYRVGLKSNKGSDPSEWPKHLRIQEFPNANQ